MTTNVVEQIGKCGIITIQNVFSDGMTYEWKAEFVPEGHDLYEPWFKGVGYTVDEAVSNLLVNMRHYLDQLDPVKELLDFLTTTKEDEA